MTKARPTTRGLIPHLLVCGGHEALHFYQEGLGAVLHYSLNQSNGTLAHAELSLGGALLMLAEEYPELGLLGPNSRGGTTVPLVLYVDDVDAAAARAVAAGARLLEPIRDEFYGDRVAKLEDPFGHRWGLHYRKQDLSPAELQRRMTSQG